MVLCFMLPSCSEEHFSGSISGTAMMVAQTPEGYVRLAHVRNGDDVFLRIMATVDHPLNIDIVKISGTPFSPNLHYQIDGKDIATQTRDFQKCYELAYKIVGLAPGTHILSAVVDDDFRNMAYAVIIDSTTFQVEE